MKIKNEVIKPLKYVSVICCFSFLAGGCDKAKYLVYLYPKTTPANVTIVGTDKTTGSSGDFHTHILTERELKRRTVDFPQLEFQHDGYKPYAYQAFSVPMDSIRWVYDSKDFQYTGDVYTKPIILEKDLTYHISDMNDHNKK
jgi:hypothetical protein